MLFSVGTRVQFIHTKDVGIVTALLENDMVSVHLEEEDLEIPAFISDLVRAEDYIDQNPSVKAKIVPGKKKKVIQPPQRPEAEQQYFILKSLGIQLAFDPVVNHEGITQHYQIYVINDTKYDVLIRFSLFLGTKSKFKYDSKLASITAEKIGDLAFDDLNDSPTFECEIWPITTLGTGSRQAKTIKIKPKQFFKKTRTAPILNKIVHHYRVFESLEEKETKSDAKEDLKTYTKRNSRPSSNLASQIHSSIYSVSELSEFVNEIDLHIDKLIGTSKKLSNSEILRIQLAHFEEYVEKAVRLGVDRVYIIHGVGEGKLRNAIATRLLKMTEVSSFKNEFHPRYGYGATEVIF